MPYGVQVAKFYVSYDSAILGLPFIIAYKSGNINSEILI